MRRILLLRHAQTAGKQGGQRDYDRTLTPEGEQDVRKTGSFFQKSSLKLDYIVSSSAIRTRSTVAILNETLQLPMSSITFLDELYEATSDDWTGQLLQIPASVHFALLVGHNPAISMLASIWAKRGIDLYPGGYACFHSSATTWMEFTTSVNEIDLSQLNH